ncbi:hypothetical protein L0Z11_10060 [Burkholderia multivorans]|uniref:hypothetical protein n=1 Tax=Burkholderia multivorans TaxID=87883 RepID=UPI0020199496|nr:hypothetical protein [Burkholderia multivorans]UQN68049.1 hypothetical protein L0Z45_10080 [Burkholderia multivorans]UQN73778.1 hypothetical protein L0Z11_10060 [Burkholderia multivorans]
MTTDKSRADALTEAERLLLARVNDCTKPIDAADRNGILKLIDRLAASPSSQPAAAPLDDARFIAEHGHRLAQLLRIDAFDIADRDARIMAALKNENAPAPADERAAFLEWFCADTPEKQREMDKESADDCLRRGHANDRLRGSWEGFQFGLKLARAASANETGAEGANDVTLDRRDLFTKSPYIGTPAQAAEPMQVPAGWKLVRVNEHFDALIAALERAESKGYLPDSVREEWENFACDENVIAPQPPAQASALEGLTDEQRTMVRTALTAAKQFIANGVELGFIRMPDTDCPDPARSTPKLIDDALVLLAAHPGQPGIACAGGHGIAGLGRMTNDDDGFVRLQFVTEAAAEEFMEAYGPTVDVGQMPEPRAEVTDSDRIDAARAELARAAFSQANPGQSEPRECRHCGWMCIPNSTPSKTWYPLPQPEPRAEVTNPTSTVGWLLATAPHFEECKTPEPSLSALIHRYYENYFERDEAREYATRYIEALYRSGEAPWMSAR